MQTLANAVNSDASPTLTASSPIARTPTTTAGRTGGPVAGETRPSRAEYGHTPSRDIENIIRVAAVWMASVQTQIAIATSARKTLPTVSPSVLVSTYGRPPVASLPSVRLGAARIAPSKSSAPPTADVTSARRIARGAVRRGSRVSSDSSPALSKPTIT